MPANDNCNRPIISAGCAMVSLFALLVFLTPTPVAARPITFQSLPVLLVGAGSFGANQPTFTVTGPLQFADLENTGIGTVDFTIAANPGTFVVLTMIQVNPGLPTDDDDLMAIVGKMSMPNPPAFSNMFIVPAPAPPANGTLTLSFNPFDNSGVNDGDFGTTPFTVTLDYSDFFCMPALPCGVGAGNVMQQQGQVTFDIDGTTLDPGVPNPPGTFPVPENGSGGYMLIGIAAILPAVLARQRPRSQMVSRGA